MAANAAVAVARLGGEAEYWGRVADDTLGRRILEELRDEGVVVASARRVPGCRSPATSILVADDGERLICSFADPSLDADPSWLPLERVSSYDAVLADVRWPRGSAQLLDAARSAGRPALLDADVGSLPDVLDLVGRATHVLFSAAGLEAVAPGEHEPAALRRLRTRAHRLVGVTVGRSGFLWVDDDGEHVVRAPEIAAVDTLAAGDVWHGAFALAIAEGQRIEVAARFANAAAAIKCQRHGGRTGAPSRPEVERLLAQRW
jgi:sulfofructose kinase